MALPSPVLTFLCFCRNEDFCEEECGCRERGDDGGLGVHVLFGDELVVAKRFLFFLVSCVSRVAGQDGGVVMFFCGGVGGGVGPLSCTIPPASIVLYFTDVPSNIRWRC